MKPRDFDIRQERDSIEEAVDLKIEEQRKSEKNAPCAACAANLKMRRPRRSGKPRGLADCSSARIQGRAE